MNWCLGDIVFSDERRNRNTAGERRLAGRRYRVIIPMLIRGRKNHA